MSLSLNRHFDMYIKHKLCLSTQSGGIKSTKCSLVSATRPSYLEDMITILHFQAGKCRKTLTCWYRVKAGSSRHKGQKAQLWNRWEATISVVTMSHHDHKHHQNTNQQLDTKLSHSRFSQETADSSSAFFWSFSISLALSFPATVATASDEHETASDGPGQSRSNASHLTRPPLRRYTPLSAMACSRFRVNWWSTSKSWNFSKSLSLYLGVHAMLNDDWIDWSPPQVFMVFRFFF